MRITSTQPLFAWDALDDSRSLATLRELLAAIPDAKGRWARCDARSSPRHSAKKSPRETPHDRKPPSTHGSNRTESAPIPRLATP
jgi:hypothetical protein